MKRLVIILAIALFLTSCSNDVLQSPDAAPADASSATTGGAATRPSEAPPDVTQIADDGYDDNYIYTANNASYLFDVDENGIVYLTSFNNESITAYDMNGDITGEYPVQEGSITGLSISDGKIFYSCVYRVNPDDPSLGRYTVFYCYDIDNDETITLYTATGIFDKYGDILKIAYLNGKLYILGKIDEYITDEYNIYTSPEEVEQAMLRWGVDTPDEIYGLHPYIYDGRILAAYDIDSQTFEIVYDTLTGLINNFTVTPYGTILYQAYDPDYPYGGVNDRYYFAELYPETMSVGDRVYRGTGPVLHLATDGWGIMYSSMYGHTNFGDSDYIYYWSLGEDTGRTRMMNGVVNPEFDVTYSCIAYCNGFTFALNQLNPSDPSMRLERVRNTSVIDFAPPIKIIGASSAGDVPRSGFNIDFTVMTPDDFSLFVLSGGVSYDIAYVRTQQDYAHNIREQGAFYPLNNVPGVREYIDACFPYIRDAATDKYGDIWMLPISNYVAAVIFDENNCKQAGLDFANSATVEDILYNIHQGVAYNSSGLNYAYQPVELVRVGLAKYLANNVTLDTPEFRDLAPVYKAFISERGYAVNGTSLPYLIRDRSGANPDFLFDSVSLQTSSHLIEREGIAIINLAGKDGINPADVVFLCVNSGSDKLDIVFEYISYVCETLLTERKDTGLFIDAGNYTKSEYAQKRRAMYENAVISFAVSNEVFASDFSRYLNSEIDLETLIKEAGRKLAMYLGE